MSRRYRALFAALLLICVGTIATAAPRRDDGNGNAPAAPSLIRLIVNKLHKLFPVILDDGNLSIPKP